MDLFEEQEVDSYIIDRFTTEVETLANVCASVMKSEVTREDDELFPPGILLYEPIDPIIERGLIATIRLFTDNENAIEFSRIANMLSKRCSNEKEKVKLLRKKKKEFRLLVESDSVYFDQYENILHLH